MGNRALNLNEPPETDEFVQHIMLQKDKKPICLTKCLDIPLTVPSLWSVIEFKPISIFCKLGLPRFQIYPEHENTHQKKEWGLFLRFLWKNKMVGVVRTELCNFYILAPDECPEFTHAVVLYRTRNAYSTSDDQEAVTSGEIHNESRTSAHSEDLVQESSTDGHRSLSNRGPTNVLNHGVLYSMEEKAINSENCKHHVGDNVGTIVCLNAETLDTCYTTKISLKTKNPSDDLKLLHTAMNSSPQCDCSEDTQCQSQPTSSLKNDIKRNFVRTDPSYLTTLGQTHSGWIFGALAELVDNSRDANATKLNINIDCLYSKKARDKIPVLSVVDDGDGMYHTDIVRMLSFGHKNPHGDDPNRIGRFGIGFKTGAMKLGEDALVLTQTSRSRSVALLSQSYNRNNDNLEIPIITYSKQGHYMEVDSSIQSEEHANFYLQAIKEFSPFNEYFIGEKLGLFGEMGTGTQIYIWNLDKWGSGYSLEWSSGNDAATSPQDNRGDILIRSRRLRSRPGQISQKIPLDYSLHAYLEVIFLDPRMKLYVQGSPVKSRPLAKYLNNTTIVKGQVMGKPVQLTLGISKLEWDRMNCGIFVYWHGRLIEAYKRVGGMVHNADMGRGVVGVVDVTDIMSDGNGNAWVLNNKQGFQDCEMYAKLEEWLGSKTDEYWDDNFDKLDLRTGNATHKPDHEWVQCNKCRKWRILSTGFDIERLPPEWFCYMPPFNGRCEIAEQQVARGVITVASKRTHCESDLDINQNEEKITKFAKTNNAARWDNHSILIHERSKQSDDVRDNFEGNAREDSSRLDEHVAPTPRRRLRRLRRGPSKRSKQK